ncbi:MAG: CinA family nicotinamide mononucleotide deamidase-related protein, partial [Verrucomicrobiota bacterium]
MNFGLRVVKLAAVQVEIINTGSELMLGFILNTHQQWLCRKLSDAGYLVSRQTSVHDSGPIIAATVRESLGRAPIVLVTGGLGPTSDDLTRDCIAALLGKKLHEDGEVLANIERFFAGRNRPMPPQTRVQALVPEGAKVLPNAHGTAPGLLIELDPRPFGNAQPSAILCLLPGPPRELRPMFSEQVMPWLLEHVPPETVICRTFKTSGLGESIIQEKIAAPLQSLTDAGLELGYCARIGEVDVRIVARGAQAETVAREAECIIKDCLGDSIFGADEASLEQCVIAELTERRLSLAVAESCTGGLIAHRLTNVPGASAVFRAGLVTYSNDAKEEFLDVRAETLAAHGAVSEPVAREMAEGVRVRTSSDLAVAVTGIAGPSGGSETK